MPAAAKIGASDGIFDRFVEPGRIALVRYGPLTGKVVTIVDIVDLARVLVDGPTTGVKRQMLPIKWLDLTEVKFKLPRAASEKILKKQLAASGAMATWEASKWAKKIAASKEKSSLTDMGRFKLQMAKKKVSMAVRKAVKPSKK